MKYIEKGGIDADRLEKFIEKNITSKYKKKLIIMDNASSHKKDKIQEFDINKYEEIDNFFYFGSYWFFLL